MKLRKPSGPVILARQELSHRLAGDPADHLAEDEAAGERVIGEAAARHGQRLGRAQDGEDAGFVGEKIERDGHAVHGGDAGAVGEDLPEGDGLLPVRAELRDVLDDPVVEVQDAALVEEVDDHRGHRLGRGVEVEERVVADALLRRVLRGARRVPAEVTDRPVEHHLAPAPHAERDGRLKPRPVEADDRAPYGLDVLGREAGLVRRDLGAFVDARDFPRRKRAHVKGKGGEEHAPGVSKQAQARQPLPTEMKHVSLRG